MASGGDSSTRYAGLSLSRPLLLRSTGCRRAGSVVVAHGLSCSVACGIFPDQGSNPCPLYWQADSQPVRHQGSPQQTNFKVYVERQKIQYSQHNTKEEYDVMEKEHLENGKDRASLLAQWLGVCLPVQGTRVRALVWEDPTCRGATRPVSHNY